MRQPSLGALELETLRFLTDRGALSVADMVMQFGEPRGLARTTVVTVMERLRQKGYLSRAKVEGVYRYTARISRMDLLKGLVRDFVQQTLGGSVAPFTAYLTEADDITPEELADLQ